MITFNAQTSRHLSEPDHEALLQWIRDHGLNPSQVTTMIVTDCQIEAQVLVLDDKGLAQIDPLNCNTAWVETRCVPFKTPVPEVPRGHAIESATQGETP